MLDHFFARRESLERIQTAPFQEYLLRFADDLHTKGYSRGTAHSYLLAGADFFRWLAEQGIPLDDVEMRHVEEYLCGSVEPSGIQTGARPSADRRAAARHMVRIVQATRPAVQPKTPAEASLVEFREHLRSQCGFVDGTARNNARHVRDFLEHFFGDGPVQVPRLAPSQLAAYVVYSAQHSLQKARFVTGALRTYFRFLQFHGNPMNQLIMAIPRVAHPPLRLSARETLTEAQSQVLLGSFDLARPKEQRDYAMALCMLDLGMRSSDVAQLTLDDINWKDGVICVPCIKTRRPYQLPLPARLGRAIATYLSEGRPKTSLRQVFLRHHTPVKNLEVRAVHSAMHTAYVRAGFSGDSYACHILRRTAATRMHRAGVPLKEIADILGHQSINTTLIYTRLDPLDLAKVALPWPGGRP